MSAFKINQFKQKLSSICLNRFQGQFFIESLLNFHRSDLNCLELGRKITITTFFRPQGIQYKNNIQNKNQSDRGVFR